MRLTRASRLIILTAAFAGAGALPTFADTAATAPAAASVDVLPAITVTTVSTRKLEDRVLASGLIQPVEQVSVAPLIEGQPIESLSADVGDAVKAGQVLATLSTATLMLQQSQLQASLASAKASADEAQRTANRSSALFTQGSTPASSNDQAQMALIAAQAQQTSVEAQLKNIELLLSRTQVVAPVDGVILSRNAQIGAVASAAGQPMFTIMKNGALELRADVAEADIPRVAVNQTASVSFAATLPPVNGVIRMVEPVVDTTTRLGRVRVTLDSPVVHVGMYAEADILVAARDTVAVPVTAVGSEGTETTVMLVKDGVVHRTAVKTGIRDGGWVEVLSGLSDGDQIVAKAGAFVNDGDKINPVASATN